MAKKKKGDEVGPVFSQPYKCGGCGLIVPFKHLPNPTDPRKDAWQCTTPGCLFIYKAKYRILKVQKSKTQKKTEETIQIPVERPPDYSILDQISTV